VEDRSEVSAEELMRRLEADPKWVAERDARQARRAARAQLEAADETSLVAGLAAVAVSVSSVYDFVGQRIAPAKAIPVLLRHLDVDHHPSIREGVIRALGVPGARPLAFDRLRAEYRRERDPNLQWVIANALSGMARLEELSDLPGIEQYAGLFA
jgi:hypothetical protein